MKIDVFLCDACDEKITYDPKPLMVNEKEIHLHSGQCFLVFMAKLREQNDHLIIHTNKLEESLKLISSKKGG